MTPFLWPAVAVVGLVLAYLVARGALVHSSVNAMPLVAMREELASAQKRIDALEEEVRKTQARMAAVPGDRAVPFGLQRQRGTGP